MTRPLDELLCKTLEIPAGPQRDAWIEVACGSDVAIVDALRKLIAAHERAPRSFLSPVVEPTEEPCASRR